MTGLWDAERDADEAARALAGMAALLRREDEDPSGAHDEGRQLMLSLAENGVAAAARVRDYLRDKRGAGDGEVATVPPGLAPWRDWTPSHGHLFGAMPRVRRAGEVPQPRRCDPGE
ncbi:hypothetical protein [Actinoplanes sp. NPDC051851]|uniref:hypothetical protein n=1 Tax=Actinoplanes sp. NPDC051851 TaxID=3154753 RepID=UPI00343C710C